MKEIRDECVGCPPEMGCLGIGCPYRNVEVTTCDQCGKDASYNIDGEDLCERCAADYLLEAFKSLTLEEQAECLGIDLKDIDG